MLTRSNCDDDEVNNNNNNNKLVQRSSHKVEHVLTAFLHKETVGQYYATRITLKAINRRCKEPDLLAIVGRRE